ncbi:aminotransferase-like domain-containing protein [Paenibacillus arenilitoris]|uniref:PLP-dependent aminotransferase family protein n=1 Tax=Paenibacillus arenilitoris TaxID=2772299 RepID=A0A927H8V9_9BACL|nr:PLP-dependent aminotransferase family protein [Paenibacillus arenilitoris]MBD2872103.1 PLP-dependent aminotransferase family protein [Paenibacillus arenilitoris]
MEYRFSSMASRLKPPSVRDRLKLSQGKDVISFADEWPAEELFPAHAVREAAGRVIAGGAGALHGGAAEGYAPLRVQLCGRMAARQMAATPEQMIVTAGSQQAIDLLVSVLAEPGDAVLVEKPTSSARLQLFALRGLKAIEAESDEQGIVPEDAERLILEHRPKLMYASPTFGSPTGRVWSLERRTKLLALCKHYQIPIIEDDPYGDLVFEPNERLPTLFALEGGAERGTVFYASAFSGTVAPPLRAGWAIGDSGVIRMAAKMKQAAGQHSSAFDQQILSRLLENFDLDAHIRQIAGACGERMLEMHEQLLRQGLRDVSWQKPKGGLFLWLELPDGLDGEALLRLSIRKGVSFVPGGQFYAQHPRRNCIRLNFACHAGERTKLGVERLAEAIGEFTARS